MRKAFAVLSALLLATTLSFAADDDKFDKVTGCLMQIGEDYIVTDPNGVKFEIDGMNDQLKANLGRVVEITGEFEGRSQDDDHKALKIDAKELKVVAGDCSAQAVKLKEGQAAGIGAAASTAPAASGQVTAQSSVPQTSSTSTTTPSASGSVTQQTTTTTTTTTKAPEGSTVTSDTAQSQMPAAPSASGSVSAAPSTSTSAAAAGTVRPEGDAAITPGNSGQETDTGKRSITGCVSRSGDHFILTEQGTGTVYRLDGEGDKLDDHVGHMVTLTGEAEKLNEASSSGAQMEFDVEELRHVSEGCTAAPKQ